MPSSKEVLHGSCFGCSHYDVCAYQSKASKVVNDFTEEKKNITMSVPYPFRIALICDKWEESIDITYY